MAAISKDQSELEFNVFWWARKQLIYALTLSYWSYNFSNMAKTMIHALNRYST
ncbi:hypothetical protein Sjap_002375 [Stephania japonica]|uniref:Uncharacterized protein n=1 Tax=Stephania japonica TaxID=461633 RepID=A0AAP0KMP5_9MAGN